MPSSVRGSTIGLAECLALFSAVSRDSSEKRLPEGNQLGRTVFAGAELANQCWLVC